MPEDDTLNQCQPDTRTSKFFVRVQSLEDAEQLSTIFLVKADAVVFHIVNVLVLVARSSDFDSRIFPSAAELDRIIKEIDEDLTQHGRIPSGRRERFYV